MGRPEILPDSIVGLDEPTASLHPNEHMLSIMREAEVFAPSAHVGVSEARHLRNVELVTQYREGDPAALGQLLLNSTGMARRLIFGLDRRGTQPFFLPVVHSCLAEIPSVDIDDVWQETMLNWFETLLPKWDPEAGAKVTGYLQQFHRPSRQLLGRHFSIGVPSYLGNSRALEISRDKHNTYETPIGTGFDGMKYEPTLAIPKVLTLDNAPENAAIDYAGADAFDRTLDHNAVLSLMGGLDKRQKFVVAETVGLLDGIPKKGEDIGKQFGLSKQRVNQIYHQAIKIMRERAEAQNTLDEYAMRERNLEQEQTDEANFELKNMHSAAQAAFGKFVDQGITNPDDLDLSDSDVIAANQLLDAWSERIEPQTTELSDMLEFNFVRSTFYIDAGFTDPDYIDEVANDWLAQDADKARAAGLDDVATKIEAKIDELNNILPVLPRTN